MRRKLWAADCETDPFKIQRVPAPFIWGAFDGKEFLTWRKTKEFVNWLKKQRAIVYAHNGGKFDWFFLLPYVDKTRVRIISGRIAELTIGKAKLRDSYSIIPVPLAAIQKGKIDYKYMEADIREEHMDDKIIPYLQEDCEVLYKSVKAYREVAGKSITIASNALASSRKLGADPGRTNHRFDTQFRKFYFGGRTECFQPGEHRNGKIIDIVSSYPKAMINDHPTGTKRYNQDNLNSLTTEQIQRSFIKLTCTSKGALPKRKDDGGLSFPHGRFDFDATGWEYLVALKHDLISDIEFHQVTTFENSINFEAYINHWFTHKKNHPKSEDPINYTIGKTQMTSLYGKLAQNPCTYYDYEMLDPGTPVNDVEGWQRYSRVGDVEIHRRSVEWTFKNKYGVDWEKQPLYFNVATGASVTGYARAALLDALHTVGPENVIYCDTDSLALHPCDLSGLSLGKELGQWEVEGEFDVGYFAGKKLYAMRLVKDGKPVLNEKGEQAYKIASKGSKLDYEKMKAVTEGDTILWENEAPTFSVAKGIHFVKRNIRMTAGDDYTERIIDG